MKASRYFEFLEQFQILPAANWRLEGILCKDLTQLYETYLAEKGFETKSASAELGRAIQAYFPITKMQERTDPVTKRRFKWYPIKPKDPAMNHLVWRFVKTQDVI
jgi:hypothetical protein